MTFAKHVQLAERMYIVHCALHARLQQRWDAETRRACVTSWVHLWDQLDQARTIAVQRGRDVSRLDAARRRGNPHALDSMISRGNREAARRAFEEVRRCLPEIVVPTELPRPTPMDALVRWAVYLLSATGLVAGFMLVHAC